MSGASPLLATAATGGTPPTAAAAGESGAAAAERDGESRDPALGSRASPAVTSRWLGWQAAPHASLPARHERGGWDVGCGNSRQAPAAAGLRVGTLQPIRHCARWWARAPRPTLSLHGPTAAGTLGALHIRSPPRAGKTAPGVSDVGEDAGPGRCVDWCKLGGLECSGACQAARNKGWWRSGPRARHHRVPIRGVGGGNLGAW